LLGVKPVVEEIVDENVSVRGREMGVDGTAVSETLPVILTRLDGAANVGQNEVQSGDPNEVGVDAAGRREAICEAKSDETVVGPEKTVAERDIVRKAWILGGGRRDRGDR
jgi:hypothetical protein